MLMVSASDWTMNTNRVEFPAVGSIYRLLGAEQNIETFHQDQVHNYNKESREAVYAFLGARLRGTQGPISEARFTVEMPQDLLAMSGRERPRPAPSGGPRTWFR